MLYKVETRTPAGDLLTLQLDDITDGFIVEEIGGLDPVKATIVDSNFAQQDGTQFQAASRESRNITVKMAVDPVGDGEVEELRARLYRYFMPKSQVSMRFYSTNGMVVDASGRVESFEFPLFVQEPEANLSIICFDPDFIDPVPVVNTGWITTASSPSNLVYDGTVNTGMDITINVAAITSEITIYQTTPAGEIRQLDFAGSLVPGDTLKISTVAGRKGATLTRAGVDSSVLYGVSPQSTWLQLEPGINPIQVYATSTPGSVATITYSNRYGGM